MDDSTKNVTTAHRSIALATRFWDRNLLFETLMRACGVEELDVIAHDTSQVRLVDDQQLIQAFVPRGSNPAFHEGIGIRCANGGGDHVDTFGAKDRVESVCELLVVIPNQKSDARVAVFQLPHELAGLLLNPCAVRMRRATSEMDASTTDLNEHEDIDRLQKQRFHGEKVTRQQLLLIVGHQMTPTRRRLAFWRRRNVVAS